MRSELLQRELRPQIRPAFPRLMLPSPWWLSSTRANLRSPSLRWRSLQWLPDLKGSKLLRRGSLLPRHSNRAANALNRPPSGGAAEVSTVVADPSRTAMALHLLETCRMTTCRIDYVHEGTGDATLESCAGMLADTNGMARHGDRSRRSPHAIRTTRRLGLS